VSQPNGQPVPDPDQPAAQSSHWGRLPNDATTGAGQQSGGASSGSGWASQAGQTHFGYSGADPAEHGLLAPPVADGPELATADDLQEHSDSLHSRLDELGSKISGLASRGQQQSANSNLQHLANSMALPARSAPVSPLAVSAQAREAANQQAAGAQQMLRSGQQRTLATFQQRQAQGGMRSMQPTGNAMGSSTAEASMNGLLGRQVGGGTSANGQSESTFANTRFQS
jgi:hypothetical protein